ncbi:MAG: CinA family nicotinamide mononucleotide deamidase-related protein [Peptoniphilaceae bacterium]|nr:CinA family nicotinamide mononucleotide deamidase-related protein [Peptoniphilaceae bacterium]MDY6018901.1 CinA family nicotinamide mononucleotide deamidase-related protein [Anaerococcus sp.]
MKGQIFSVGTEILLGNIVDTNSQYLAQRLAELGINVYKMLTVGDNFDRLYFEMKEASKTCDYIFVTGGLGPTPDDISKEVAIKVAEKEDLVELNQAALKALRNYFNDNKIALENNIKQAKFPKDAIVLENEVGTAPGCIIETKNACKIILMPGPPREMKRMFENHVLNYLKTDGVIESRIFKIGILGEWDMARRVDFRGENPTLSPYFTDDGAYIRVSAKAESKAKALKMIKEKEAYLDKIFGPLIICKNGQRKEEILLDLLRSRSEKVATAESITGGLIASSIIDIAGASDCLKESYIVYSDQAKEKILNVSHETLEKYSAVSKETAREMLQGLYDKTRAELCIVTTGYAHLGQVYLGIKYHEQSHILELKFAPDRNKVRLFTRNRAIDASIIIMRGSYESYISF